MSLTFVIVHAVERCHRGIVLPSSPTYFTSEQLYIPVRQRTRSFRSRMTGEKPDMEALISPYRVAQ